MLSVKEDPSRILFLRAALSRATPSAPRGIAGRLAHHFHNFINRGKDACMCRRHKKEKSNKIISQFFVIVLKKIASLDTGLQVGYNRDRAKFNTTICGAELRNQIRNFVTPQIGASVEEI